MKEYPFEDGGALLSDSLVYIEREADRQALRHLQRMEYLTLVEPRQQGKTSLINWLTGRLTPQGYVFAYTDLTTFDRSDEATWYGSLCEWLLRQAAFIAPADRPKLPTNGNTWRNFLCDLAEAAEKGRFDFVLALDEVGATPTAWATDFFSAIRSVYNSRQSMPCFRHLTFVVAGAFDPKELIRDRTISNFNVDHRIPLDDLDLERVSQLVRLLELDDDFSHVAERLHYWAGGQPFITQRLCRYLAEQVAPIVPDSIDAAVDRFFREDTNHLPRILSDLQAEPELLNYARSAVDRRIKFSPSVNDWQFRLSHVIGIIAPDQDGRCRIRNRIYEQALQFDASLERNGLPDPPTSRKNEISNMVIPGDFSEQLCKGSAALFCGAGISISKEGIPSGNQLARELAQRACLGDVGGMTLPDVAQGYEMEMGHQSLIAFIAERIESAGHAPLRTHQLIATLPFKRIITTNWDTLLEEALRQAGKPVARVVRDEDVAYVDEEKVTLIKLHGCIDQKDTLVVTGDDFYNVFARLPETANLVRGFFATKTLLFLGYGLADEDFKRMYHEVERHLGKHKRRAYAVQLNPTALAVKYWQQKNVEVIAADATAFLEALAAQLTTHGASPAPRQATRPPADGVAQPVVNPTGHSQSIASGQPARSTPSITLRGHDMDYERGLEAMKRLAVGTDWLTDFTLYEARLRENLRDERRFGPSPQTSQDRSRVVGQLNALALQHLGVSFNDLCMGKHVTPQPQAPVSDPEVVERLRRIEEKIDHGRTEDRESAAKILDALVQNRVAQDDANKMMADLQTWAQGIQQAGLPLSPELRAAMDALTEHSGSAYQYLQVALPIIPGILTYNVELGSQHQAVLKALWERMKARFVQ